MLQGQQCIPFSVGRAAGLGLDWLPSAEAGPPEKFICGSSAEVPPLLLSAAWLASGVACCLGRGVATGVVWTVAWGVPGGVA